MFVDVPQDPAPFRPRPSGRPVAGTTHVARWARNPLAPRALAVVVTDARGKETLYPHDALERESHELPGGYADRVLDAVGGATKNPFADGGAR